MTVDVRLDDVTRRFGPVVAVDRATLHLPAGQVTALMGPSGCGKTTTLRLVAGFEAPDAGRISIGGDVVAGNGRLVPPERRRVGMVFQQLALFPHLDVAANIGYGLPRRGRQRRVDELLELIGLAGYGSRYPDQLSGGQAQRVAVARALAPGPRVLLLDEPFSSLDVSLRGELREEVRRILRAEQVTALLVTHDQDEALSLGDQVAVMLGGRIVQVGRPEEVYLHPATPAVAEFVGNANLLPGAVDAGGRVSWEFGTLDAVGNTGAVVVLVRPEDLDLTTTEDGPGVVEEVTYYGHDQVILVALPSGRHVRVRAQTRSRLDVGTRVRVDVRPGVARVFPGASPPTTPTR